MRRQASLEEMFHRMESERKNISKTKELRKGRDKNEKKDLKKESGKQQKAKNDGDSNISEQTEKIPHYNAKFYRNEISSNPSGDFIDIIHKKWWGNYKLLEEHHGFIQWLFPNMFRSRFNSHSFPLAPEEIQQFKNNEKMLERYVKSYMMMLQFYGMKLRSKATGEIVRSRNPKYSLRYEATLLSRFHNHMRITRILSSLTILGFGRYAKELTIFLEKEINGPDNGLKELKKYGVFDREWKEFKDYKQKQSDMNIYLKKRQQK